MTQKVIFEGATIKCTLMDEGYAELCLDHSQSSVNKLDKLTLSELEKLEVLLQKTSEIKGLLIYSAKESFVVGADVTEFLEGFAAGPEKVISWLKGTHKTFNGFEDLPFPTVACLTGPCLGGGCELALTADFRIGSDTLSIGFPETKLGIIPGWGGTVRTPRLVGVDHAIEWIASGNSYRADAALKVGIVDGLAKADQLLTAGRDMLGRAIAGHLPWQARKAEKKQPVRFLSPIEANLAFESARGVVAAQAYPNYPAPLKALDVMQKAAGLEREGACDLEIKAFAELTQTPVAESLISIFLADQAIKRKTKSLSAQAKPVAKAGVIGAGIMGGGICYQAASKKIPIIMKDINDKALDLGLQEASKLLLGQVERGKPDAAGMAKVLCNIRATLSYGDFAQVDCIVEAVVENEKVKKAVCKDLEAYIREDAVLASNTSTISITKLAEGLKRPEKFCGMHFFNPVHKMPLVEVIRGAKTSDETIATTVAFATKMGKTPIVVNDCPGFLVNRLLFPYFGGFESLLRDGVSFTEIDKVMEKFGWPMGPAYLLDVVGLDTAVHAAQVMADGFPDRMKSEGFSAIGALKDQNRLGQKNGLGFYAYTADKKGRPKKVVDPSVVEMLAKLTPKTVSMSPEDIIDRMMIPMINEAARCLEENIVASPHEVDLGVIYGLGFPPFRGGLMKYADSVGLKNLKTKMEKFASVGPCYPAASLVEKHAAEGTKFYC